MDNLVCRETFIATVTIRTQDIYSPVTLKCAHGICLGDVTLMRRINLYYTNDSSYVETVMTHKVLKSDEKGEEQQIRSKGPHAQEKPESKIWTQFWSDALCIIFI